MKTFVVFLTVYFSNYNKFNMISLLVFITAADQEAL